MKSSTLSRQERSRADLFERREADAEAWANKRDDENDRLITRLAKVRELADGLDDGCTSCSSIAGGIDLAKQLLDILDGDA